MLSYIWPIVLIMVVNIIYQVCAKEVPASMDAFATTTICYAVSTAAVLVCFFIFSGTGIDGLIAEYAKVNWAVIMMGVTAVGLELGFVFCYKNGWEVSMAYVVESALLSTMLLFVGYFVFSEGITWNKIGGVIICLAGLVLINRE